MANKENNISSELIVLNATKDILAGSVRGMAQVGHPLDTVKVRLQTQDAKNPRYSGVMDCLRKTTAQEGLLAFYKGASSPICMAAFYSAVLFFAYGQAKRLFHDERNNYFSFKEMVNIGMFSGFFAGSVECPMDLVKSKLQVQYSKSDKIYNNAIDAARKLVKQHGVTSLYQGFSATICRNIPGTIVYFYCYESIRRGLKNWTGSEELKSSHVLLAGGVSGTLFWVSIYPLDVVKSRLQTDATPKDQRKYKGLLDCIQKTYHAEGIRAFYKGFKVCFIRAFPTNAASFVAFEFTRNLLG